VAAMQLLLLYPAGATGSSVEDVANAVLNSSLDAKFNLNNRVLRKNPQALLISLAVKGESTESINAIEKELKAMIAFLADHELTLRHGHLLDNGKNTGLRLKISKTGIYVTRGSSQWRLLAQDSFEKNFYSLKKFLEQAGNERRHVFRWGIEELAFADDSNSILNGLERQSPSSARGLRTYTAQFAAYGTAAVTALINFPLGLLLLAGALSSEQLAKASLHLVSSNSKSNLYLCESVNGIHEENLKGIELGCQFSSGRYNVAMWNEKKFSGFSVLPPSTNPPAKAKILTNPENAEKEMDLGGVSRKHGLDLGEISDDEFRALEPDLKKACNGQTRISMETLLSQLKKPILAKYCGQNYLKGWEKSPTAK
jgi:hypothetical protein